MKRRTEACAAGEPGWPPLALWRSRKAPQAGDFRTRPARDARPVRYQDLIRCSIALPVSCTFVPLGMIVHDGAARQDW
jgi:hypothetical protein